MLARGGNIMKKYVLILLMCFCIILAGCELIMQPAPTPEIVVITQNPNITQVPLATQAPEITQPPITTETSTDTSLPTIVTSTPAPTPHNTMDFYSCYAHMASYNPANGWAEFDYFYLHQGQDAIDYLVEYEGYTVADAETYVNGFADSEFVEQNNNSSLRTIDLNTVTLKTIVNHDGSVGPDLLGTVVNTTHLNSLYAANPNNLLNYLFYYVECDSNGNVIEVRQVYWP